MPNFSSIFRGLAILVVAIIPGSLTAYSPGCSFVSDQCVYSIELGHQKQCDQPGSTNQMTGTSGCCENVTDTVNEMKNQMKSLQKQVELLQTLALSTTSSNKENVSSAAAVDNIPTSEELQRLQLELNATKEKLDLERSRASNEVRDLHERLANATANLQLCQLAAGIESSGVDTGSVYDTDTGNHSVMYCNFDTDMCGFTIPPSSGSNLRLGRIGSYSANGMGPRYDHSAGIHSGTTLGFDAYSMAISSYSTSLQSREAYSPVLPPSSSYCIVFWYFMKGRSTRDLIVNLSINGGMGYPIFSKSGPQSDHWQLAKVDIDFEYTSHNFQVVFKVTSDAHRDTYNRKQNEDGSIAVDDLYIFNTTCSNVPRYPSGSYKAVYNGTTSHYTFHTQPQSWTDAYDMCRRQSPWSALLSIDTAEEQQYIVDTIKKDTTFSIIGQSGFYTSGTDRDNEHHFTWTDTGTPRAVPGGFWHAGQPNNVGGDQDCLLLQYAGDDYRWGDVECASKHPFICEVSM